MEGGRIWPIQCRSRFQLSFVRPPLSLNRRRTSYVFRAVDFQKNKSRMSVPIINFLKEDFSTGDIRSLELSPLSMSFSNHTEIKMLSDRQKFMLRRFLAFVTDDLVKILSPVTAQVLHEAKKNSVFLRLLSWLCTYG